MSRLIVLSNRVKMPDDNPMAGGLAVAMHEVLQGDSNLWMGWNGEIIDSSSTLNNDCDTNEFIEIEQSSTANANNQAFSSKITYMTTALTSQQYQHFYCGFANNVLWLLLHEQPHLITQAPEDYAGYQTVNRLFAQQLKKIIQPDDVIWVHDYHFLSVAFHCRQLGINNRIGFFLHIPFAPLPLWQQLKQSAKLIEHLAHYDVIGTQTEQDKANGMAVFAHYLQNRSLNNNRLDSHLIIKAYPIGINVAKIQQQVSHLTSSSSQSLSIHSTSYTQSLSANLSTRKSTAQQIIAVDRIDYSKGLLERFSAYQSFLQHYPQYQNQLNLLQIACPSRLDLPVYQRLYHKVRQKVAEVNQHFSSAHCSQSSQSCQISHIDDFKTTNLRSTNSDSLTLELDNFVTDTIERYNFETSICQTNALPTDPFSSNNNANPWHAIDYSETVVDRESLMSAFWHSDVGWVNSLKDGMNLVAKEYIAAQNPDNPGVLLLSCYAGAAEQMQAAIIIDPHHPQSIIQGLNSALTMSLGERKSRYQTLLQGLQQDDLHAWQRDFLDDLYSR